MANMPNTNTLKALHALISLVAAPQNQLNNSTKGFYTESELGVLLGVSVATLRRWRRMGNIGYTKPGRQVYYTMEDVTRLMKDFHQESYSENPFLGVRNNNKSNEKD